MRPMRPLTFRVLIRPPTGDTHSVPICPLITTHKNNPELLIGLIGKLSLWPKALIPTSVSGSKCVFWPHIFSTFGASLLKPRLCLCSHTSVRKADVAKRKKQQVNIA